VTQIKMTPDGDTLKIELEGDLAAMLAAASPQAEDLQRTVKLVAGARSRRDLTVWWTSP
jgi:hypothetical protein